MTTYQKDTLCSFVPCEHNAIAKGLCPAHYRQMRKGVELYSVIRRPKVECRFEGCARLEVTRGLCGGHYNREAESERPQCTVENCGRPTQNLKVEYCTTHNKQFLAGEPFSEIVRWGRYKRNSVECVVPGCARIGHAKDLCPGHYQKWRSFKMTPDQMSEFDNAVECQSCGRNRPLAVDHDRACCDTMDTCGKCIRGFICQPCNLALGHVGDDIETLERLVNYLKARQAYGQR